MNDKTLQQDVLDELDFEPSVNAANIGVAVDKGVVTLSGHVGSYAEKLAAERAARRVKGVLALAGNVQVRFPDDKKTADDEIARRALNILHWSTTLPKDAIAVTVDKGWIHLGGQVEWQYQRALVEAAVRRLSGVSGVVNGIRVKPRVQGCDIKRRIEDALKRHAEIEAGHIRVSIQGGSEVALDGTVHDWRERAAVENAAWSAPGVTSVEDRLQIV
jgi:osmotically-inducible protein OsmY